MKKWFIFVLIGVLGLFAYLFIGAQIGNQIQNTEYENKIKAYLENIPSVTITGILQHWKPIDGPSYAIIPEEEMNVNMNNGMIFLYGEKLSSSLHDKKVTVTGKLIESYVDFQLETLGTAFGGDPDTATMFVSDIGIIDIESNTTANCDLAKQTPNQKMNGEKIPFTSVRSSYGEEQNIIGIVLNTDPLVLETYVDSKDPIYLLKGLETRIYYVYEFENPTTFSHLKFGQLIEATEYSYLSGEEFGEIEIRPALKNIKPLEKTPQHLINQVGEDPFSKHKTTLIKYTPTTNSNEFLIIYKDGSMYYRNNQNSIISTEELSQTQLNSLLEIFGESDFDKLEMNNINNYYPSVTLICDRFHFVSILYNEDIQTITNELDSIIHQLNSKFDLYLTYKQKIKLDVRPWAVGEIRLSDVTEWHDSALAYYQKTGKTDKNNPAYTKLPEFLESQIRKYPTSTKDPNLYVYYSEGKKLYTVSYGTCLPNSDVCQNDTAYILHVGELKEPEENLGHGIKLWPSYLSINLNEVPEDGLFLTLTEYEKHQDFYDNLFKKDTGDERFIHENYLFNHVRIKEIP